MSKKLIAVFALAAVLFTSFGVLYDSGVLAANFPAVNSAINDEYIQLGDCNADGVVNAKDVITLKLYLNGLGQIYDLTADANQDGVIDNNDVRHIAQTVATGDTVTVQNYPAVKEVADGTVLYYESFDSREQTDHGADTVTQLGWDIQNTDKGALIDSTSMYSIVPYESGNALFINNNNPWGNDSYVKLLTDAQKGYFHERNYTMQFDVQYEHALDYTRYITVLLGYSGDRYMSFHLRTGGFGGNTVRIGSSFLNLDNGGVYAADNTASNTIADKLVGGGYDGSTHVFRSKALSVRYVVDWENGCSVYARTKDTSTTSGGEWVLISKFSADSVGAAYFKPENFEAAVALKTGDKLNGYIDNILLWTGTGDEPADKSAPLLQSGNDECYNHAYEPATCQHARYCRHCDFTFGTSLEHSFVNGKCTSCNQTSQQIADTKNITNMSPANGATIQIANDTVHAYYNNFTQNTTFSESYHSKTDIYYPNNVTFSWNVEKPADYYRLNISLNSDMSDSEEYIVSSPSYTHKSLFLGKRYYWRVDAVYATQTLRSTVYTFSTLSGIRAVEIDGTSNTRDFGGYMTTDGRRVKQGMMYRGGRMDLDDGTDIITYSGIQYMRNDLGIKTDYDLRGLAGPSPLGGDINYASFDGLYYAGGERGIANSNRWSTMRAEIETFADPNNYPMYIHCSLGRDRTGTIAFLINGLLGVSERDLWMDYEFSVLSYMGGGYDTATVSALQHNLNSLIDYLNGFSGSTLKQKIENYMLTIGVSSSTIQAIRNILLEDASTASASMYFASAQVPVFNASAADNVGKDEIPYGANDTSVQVYIHETFDMMTSSEAATAGVPGGYSDHVLKLTGSGGGIGLMLDPSNINISKSNLDKVVFRVWCPANTRELRITDNCGKSWIMRYVPSTTGQWINVVLGSSGTNFESGRGVDDLYDSNGKLKPVCLVFRMSDDNAYTAYIDSVTYVQKTLAQEICCVDAGGGAQPYGYDAYNLMTESEAAAAGVPAGYSGHVLKLTGSTTGGSSTVIDPTPLKIHKSAIDKIIFRVWVPANVRGVRIHNGDWVMLYEPTDSEKGQWIEVTLGADGTNFNGSKTMDDLCDADGMLKSVTLAFRFSESVSTTVYVDSITYVTNQSDTTPPTITYNNAHYMQVTAGSKFTVPSASAYDAEEKRNVDIEYIWSAGALDENGGLVKGTHICTLSASDSSGNISTVSITVHVGNRDESAPEIFGVPETVYATTGCRAFLWFKATDNFDEVQAVVHWPSGSFDSTGRLVAGEHTVRVEATDLTGNSTEKIVKVVVTASVGITGTLVQD